MKTWKDHADYLRAFSSAPMREAADAGDMMAARLALADARVEAMRTLATELLAKYVSSERSCVYESSTSMQEDLAKVYDERTEYERRIKEGA